MGFFQWITEGTRRAIVEGIEQAAADIDARGIEADITLRLPAHWEAPRLTEEQPATTNGRRKAVAAK
jgi:hypothetical protein